MEASIRQISLAVGVLTLVAAGCSPADPRPDVADTGDTRGAVDTGGDTDDGGNGEETSSDLSLDLGQSSDGDNYDPYPDEGAEIKLVHGFQGGYHIEPSL
ncbi:MAG: hypothetical protein ABEN55_16525, partial [Bradymonadaceae bacterium]